MSAAERKLPQDLLADKLIRGSRDPASPRQVADYVDAIRTARNPSGFFRRLTSDLARRFHESPFEVQKRALQHPRPLTGTQSGCLLAAVAEHVAITHDHPVPDWCDDPQRSLKIYWCPLEDYIDRFPGALYRDIPGAFLRHGIIIGNKEFGPREGERDYGALIG